MITDIATILWKELREIFTQRPNMRGGWLGLLVLVGVFGIVIPLQSGLEWIYSPANLLIWGWVPFLLVSGVIADSFAGERERHTLETLLASRLPDRAILLGKVIAGLLYGWLITLISALLGAVTINVVHWPGYPVFYPPAIAAGIIGMSFLVSFLSATLGVLISLRASSVRQAQQTFSALFLLVFLPIILLPSLPTEWKDRVMAILETTNWQMVALWAAGALLIVDLLLLAVAAGRFRRSRLILD